MPAVGSPSFCTKQQSRNADCLIDGCFGEGTEIFINKDSSSKSYICIYMHIYMEVNEIKSLM